MQQEKVKQVIDSLLEGTEYFLVDLSVPENGQRITAYIDSDHGITIGQCAELSRKLGKSLDEMDWGEHAYSLEVSSPGLKRSLELKRQYKKNVGLDVEVYKADGSQVSGKLVYVDEDKILIDVGSQKEAVEESISFADIEKAQVII